VTDTGLPREKINHNQPRKKTKLNGGGEKTGKKIFSAFVGAVTNNFKWLPPQRLCPATVESPQRLDGNSGEFEADPALSAG